MGRDGQGTGRRDSRNQGPFRVYKRSDLAGQDHAGGHRENAVEGVPFPASPSQTLPSFKDRRIWSLPPSGPAVPRQEIGLQVPTQGPWTLSSLPLDNLGTGHQVGCGVWASAPQRCLRLLIRGQGSGKRGMPPGPPNPRLGALTWGRSSASRPQALPSRIGPTSRSRPPAPGRSSCGTLSWSCCRKRSTRVSSPGRGTTGSLSSRTPMRWLGSGASGSASPT